MFILNNLKQNDKLNTKVLYKKASLAIDESAKDIEEYLNKITQLSHIKNHQFLMCKSFLKPINRHFLI